ncbi:MULTISPECIES: tetratricopeptide repeat protein [Proteus]|uniref:tetratricopeptide repeat protein n=1 Tax=Proteus TaxID=583 RepID=UPI000F5C8167|nr:MULTISPECIES: tetratricopeptide repeat protein [Proteus]EGT3591455.1 sel1 repeat family protein [Proteus mirabilis]EHZ8012964.1 sel1 repeat family protein [Proteus mirabilis]EKV2708101.1 sel1 repeat family protein [Proteus mirabilis]EKX5060366.1 sel1 repeat family protein [Proteus mirabilis]EKX5060928.1 sel1 repeat family protein [Proteus mirabilis]
MTFIKSISTFISLITLFCSFSLHANFEEQDKKLFEDTRKEALNHNALAQYQLAEMYLLGDGVEKNLLNAQLWANEAIKSGYADAYALLADIYLFNADPYFKSYYVEAKELATTAVNKGSMRGKISLATALIAPLSGEVDYQQAMVLLEEATQGHQQELVYAPIWLGILYSGIGNIPVDMEKTNKLFAQANEMTFEGFAQAMASFMFSGQYHIIEPNKQKADAFMKQACEEARKVGNEFYCQPELN